MVDTYGAAPDEVRGFVVGGWEACRNQEGKRTPQVLVVWPWTKGFLSTSAQEISVADNVSNISHTLTMKRCT